jgi:hypothetical protein
MKKLATINVGNIHGPDGFLPDNYQDIVFSDDELTCDGNTLDFKGSEDEAIEFIEASYASSPSWELSYY